MNINDKNLRAIQETYIGMAKEQQEKRILEEGINDHEALHNDILSKFHKHYPDMNVKKAVHVQKFAGRYGREEHHTYESEIPIHDSVKHLFKSLRSRVEISHAPGEKPYARLSYAYDHHGGGSNGHNVASMGEHEGSMHIRHEASGVVHKA